MPPTTAWALDPGVVYLNHGSFGACPQAVLAVQSELRRELEANPMRFFVRELEQRADAARETLAAFLGADPDGLAFVTNATMGVNTVLASLQLQPGDELLVTDHGYNACGNAVRAVTERQGAHPVVARVPFPIDGAQTVMDAVLGAVTPRTRLALLDHITSPTGLVLPIEALVAELAARGVDTLVDGAHAPGMVDLDVDALGAAYYTGNAHKWLCAPKGAAFLWIRADQRDRVVPLVTSHGANSPRTDRSALRLQFDWTGTHDPTPYLSIPAALECVGGMLPGGWPAVRAANHGRVLAGRRLLCEALGVPEPAPESMIGSLASVPLPRPAGAGPTPAMSQDPLQARLWQEHDIEAMVLAWSSPAGRWLRLSAQLYNEASDYERLAGVLPDLLASEADTTLPAGGSP